MEDFELIALKKLKEELIVKAYNLIEQLKQQEEDQQIVTIKFLPNATKITNNLEEKLQEHYEYRLCEVSQQISGINFKNIDKKWLHDNIYKYTTYLTTKILSFYIELTVKLEDEKEFEIYDITCHFININKCFMLEIEPWVEIITKMKNFSLLTSTISQYNELSIVRKQILDTLESKMYANYENCTDENGGILLYVHSVKNIKQVYLIFQWSILFLERFWGIKHHFTITPTEIGIKFAEENCSLLKKFCKPNIMKKDLIHLWNDLCSAIYLYENKDDSKKEDI
ncbi:hypothetical protein APICC_00167 [Apis cerana cerana]|uniref:Uncharacterized protein n=1 Tax=Apis cerana cerana TaxID=94128 RepID=A0A2A3EC41_APICC|nr:hypothetical protein APICC_00167 [Apis cerana cerana]